MTQFSRDPPSGANPHAERKADHLDLCATDDVAFSEKGTLLDDVDFQHCSLPDLHVPDISLATTLVGRALAAPVVISAMTGGMGRAERVNKDLATVAEARGIAFGLGSMRPLLEHGVTAGYLVRDVAPNAVVLGNIGVVQARDTSTAQLADMIGVTGCDALCVHLNPAQEAIQAGGDVDFRGGLDTLARLVDALPVPLIVKETGSGLSRRTGLRLRSVGVTHVDVSGAGGTSWVGVETLRARATSRTLGERFWNWGVPTAASVLQVSDLGFDDVIATGGVRHGLDIARALALGATVGGLARPFLKAHNTGGLTAVNDVVTELLNELRIACLLTGCGSVTDLADVPLALGPRLLAWAHASHPVRRRLPSA